MAKQEILLETGTNELEVVEFYVNYTDSNDEIQKQSFGLNVAKVREIIQLPKITKTPDAHPSLLGVVSLRNSTIPVIDLCKYLYKQDYQSERPIVVVSEFNNAQWGLIVSDVNRIHRVSWKDISGLDELHNMVSHDSSANSVITIEDREILMLDVEKIISTISPEEALDQDYEITSLDWTPKIVTAEDSSLLRKLITQDLEKAGFEIESFENGSKAWQYLSKIADIVSTPEELDDYVDIVISDIEMPEMDGYTLTKKIKSHPILQKLPVIIFSSIVSEEVLHRGKEVGADAQITKPKMGELNHLVIDFLK